MRRVLGCLLALAGFAFATPAQAFIGLPDQGSLQADQKLVNRLRAGVVWANTFNRFDPTAPFGGYKESGFGREGGRHGLAAYLDV